MPKSTPRACKRLGGFDRLGNSSPNFMCGVSKELTFHKLIILLKTSFFWSCTSQCVIQSQINLISSLNVAIISKIILSQQTLGEQILHQFPKLCKPRLWSSKCQSVRQSLVIFRDYFLHHSKSFGIVLIIFPIHLILKIKIL